MRDVLCGVSRPTPPNTGRPSASTDDGLLDVSSTQGSMVGLRAHRPAIVPRRQHRLLDVLDFV